MTVKQLIELLKDCNPDAVVVVHVDTQIGDYTWDTEAHPVQGIMAWPLPKETASSIEINYEAQL